MGFKVTTSLCLVPDVGERHWVIVSLFFCGLLFYASRASSSYCCDAVLILFFGSDEAGSKTCPGCDHAALKIPALVSPWPTSVTILTEPRMLNSVAPHSREFQVVVLGAGMHLAFSPIPGCFLFPPAALLLYFPFLRGPI